MKRFHAIRGRAPGALAVLLLACGCLAAPGRTLTIRSDPSGAVLGTSWGETGVTPCEIRVPARSGEIQLTRAGWAERAVLLEPNRQTVRTVARLAFGLLLDPFAGDGLEVLHLAPDQRELVLHLEPAEASTR